MGVDLSHGDAHFGHRSFHAFRKALAAMAGVRLDDMKGFGGRTDRATAADSIAPLLSRSGAGGELVPEEARGAAARLAELMSYEQNREQVAGDQWEDLPAGLKEAADAGEPFVIMG